MEFPTYEQLMQFNNYSDRLDFASLWKRGYKTPSSTMSNPFYHNPWWRKARQNAIDRDFAYDLAVDKNDIYTKKIVHHLNPLTEYDIENLTDKCLDPNNLITCSVDTHNKIHYAPKREIWVERKPGDTTLW